MVAYLTVTPFAQASSQLAAKLREGHMFGGINAHEQLTEESALKLVLWLIDAKKYAK